MPEGHWIHSELLSKVDVILSNGRLPSEFGLCRPDQDLVYMIAHSNVKRLMMAVDDWVAAEEIKNK